MPGFPIRTPSDHSSVGSSPRLIAASYVLHRLLVPRHPPCALSNLATKMLASTVQFSRYGRRLTPDPRVLRRAHQGRRRSRSRGVSAAEVRKPVSLRTQQRAWAGLPTSSRFHSTLLLNEQSAVVLTRSVGL